MLHQDQLLDKFSAKSFGIAVSAVVADFASSVIKVPRELITQRMQTGQYSSSWTAFRSILRQDGVGGLFTGPGNLVRKGETASFWLRMLSILQTHWVLMRAKMIMDYKWYWMIMIGAWRISVNSLPGHALHGFVVLFLRAVQGLEDPPNLRGWCPVAVLGSHEALVWCRNGRLESNSVNWRCLKIW